MCLHSIDLWFIFRDKKRRVYKKREKKFCPKKRAINGSMDIRGGIWVKYWQNAPSIIFKIPKVVVFFNLFSQKYLLLHSRNSSSNFKVYVYVSTRNNYERSTYTRFFIERYIYPCYVFRAPLHFQNQGPLMGALSSDTTACSKASGLSYYMAR